MMCIVCPTASGKTALAVNLAKALGGEIISCDSMQLYRGMDIGTAKVTPEEAEGVPHHLVDILDIHDTFNVSDYVFLADQCVCDLTSRGKLPIFCGGTGLYIDSFTSGLPFAEYDIKDGLREELGRYAEEHGAEALHERLQSLDADSAAAIRSANVKRVIRALEVCLSTGIPFSVWQRQAKQNAVPKDALYISLTFDNREKLYERIEMRVDRMMDEGLLAEAEALIKRGLRDTTTAGQAIGYKEFYPYFDGKATLDECAESLKINSRHYAKRQLTWFSRNKSAYTFCVDTMTPDALFQNVLALCRSYLDGTLPPKPVEEESTHE